MKIDENESPGRTANPEICEDGEPVKFFIAMRTRKSNGREVQSQVIDVTDIWSHSNYPVFVGLSAFILFSS